MESIFEGAKFGDKFLFRDGRIAIYHKWEMQTDLRYCKDNVPEKWHYPIVEPKTCNIGDYEFVSAPYDKYVNVNGKGYPEFLKVYDLEDENCPNYGNVIISRYQEPIDEERLETYASESFECGENEPDDWTLDVFYKTAYKNGYRKAKGE